MVYCVSLILVNETALMVPFEILISSTVNDPFLMASLKLKVIVLVTVFLPPLPVIVKVGVVDMIYFSIVGYKFVFLADLIKQWNFKKI